MKRFDLRDTCMSSLGTSESILRRTTRRLTRSFVTFSPILVKSSSARTKRVRRVYTIVKIKEVFWI